MRAFQGVDGGPVEKRFLALVSELFMLLNMEALGSSSFHPVGL